MEATYCVGSDVDVCRMFDQYLYKRAENVDLSLSIPQSNNFQSNGYDMTEQTFHAPNFGDEEFDIPNMQPPQQQQQQQHAQQQHNEQQQQQHYQPPMQGMQQMSQQMNQQQDAMGMHDPTGGYQQPLYLSGPEQHGMVNQQYHSPQPNYSMSPSQQQQHNNQLLMIHQQQQQQHQQMMMSHGQPPPGQMGPYGASPQHPQGRGNSPPAPGQEHTTSDDSDDSTPHPAIMTAMKRPSPEPADPVLAKAQKKPKVQKKKKKRDPNEPQKPVSAYALFFRDTQAAIKGQNPNASFGEVSKIVASMWDALDSEHKNVYKKKTEAAKKEYLKALAAYRASLVSKGAGDGEGGPMYGNYGNYAAGPPGGSPYGGYQPQGTIPSPPISSGAPTPPSQSPINKKPPPSMMGGMGGGSPGQQHPGMMSGHMAMQQHMQQQQQQQHSSYMQQVPQQQHIPLSPHQQSHQQVPVSSHNPHMQQQQQQQQQQPQQHMSPPPMVPSSPPVSQAGGPPSAPNSQQPQQQTMASGGMRPQQSTCIRHGCPNQAINNPEWEDEYCSNECVVSHCRDVFSNWVAANKSQQQSFSTVK